MPATPRSSSSTPTPAEFSRAIAWSSLAGAMTSFNASSWPTCRATRRSTTSTTRFLFTSGRSSAGATRAATPARSSSISTAAGLGFECDFAQECDEAVGGIGDCEAPRLLPHLLESRPILQEAEDRVAKPLRSERCLEEDHGGARFCHGPGGRRLLIRARPRGRGEERREPE